MLRALEDEIPAKMGKRNDVKGLWHVALQEMTSDAALGAECLPACRSNIAAKVNER